MKTLFTLSKQAVTASLIACFGVAALLASCTKDNPEPEVQTGEVKIQFVNAFQGSPSQDFYTNNTRLGTTAVAYGQSSGYLTSNSSNYTFYFKDTGTSTVSAGIQGQLSIGGSYTFFYVMDSDGSKAAVAYQDDMTAPAAGKARVRFVHLNSFIANTVPLTVGVVGATALNTNLKLGTASVYFEVNANSSLVISGNGITSATVDGSSIASGKIYTIWIGGTSQTNLTANILTQN